MRKRSITDGTISARGCAAPLVSVKTVIESKPPMLSKKNVSVIDQVPEDIMVRAD